MEKEQLIDYVTVRIFLIKPICLIIYGSRYLGVDVFAIECRRFKPHMRTQFRKQYSAENDLKHGKTGKPNNWLGRLRFIWEGEDLNNYTMVVCFSDYMV